MTPADDKTDNKSFIGAILLVTGILLTAGIGLWHTFPPQPGAGDAPHGVFSSHRAMAHVKQIGLRPHPTGTNENDSVRQYLADQIAVLGYRPEIQSALTVNPDKQKAARIHNVLVRVPGAKPGKALLLAAHYDSVPTGPGAADDGASVAAMLEVLRALKHLPSLNNDVIFLFSDGEEMGLFGAEAFVNQHSWAKDIGLALNFEYRGNRGAFMMFETGSGNGKLIEGLADSKAPVWMNSLMYEVYKRLPNDTDFTVFKNAGFPGMNFAAIEGHTAYHTALDRPEFLDEGTLQQEGGIMLALAGQFGNTPLDNLKAGDRIYSDLPGSGLIHYPADWVMPLSLFAMALFAAATALAAKRKLIRLPYLALALVAYFLILTGLAYGNHLLWQAIRLIHPEYGSFSQGDTYNSHWYLAAFVLLTISLFGFLQYVTSRWFTTLESFLGAVIVWLMLAVTCALLVPGVSFLFTWPLLVILIAAFIVLTFAEKSSYKPFAIYWYFTGSIPGILLFTPLIKGLYIGMTPQMTGLVTACLTLLLGLLTPVFHALNRRKTFYTGLLALSLISFSFGSATSGFDAEHPLQNTLFYALDSDNRQAYWLSGDKQLDGWTQTFFPGQKEKRRPPGLMGESSPALWSADAPVLPLPPPQIETLADRLIDGKRSLKLKIKSVRHAPKITVAIEGIEILNSTVADQAYTRTSQSYWRLEGYGLNDEDLVIELTVKPGIPFTIRLSDISYDPPDLKQTVRPAEMIAKPGEYSDTTAVVNRVGF